MSRWTTISYLAAAVGLIFGLIGLYYLLLDWRFNRTLIGLPVGIGLYFLTAWVDSFRGIGREAAAHLGEKWDKGTVLAHRVRKRERVNIQLGLNTLLEAMPTSRPPVGIDAYKAVFDAFRGNAYKSPLRWTSLPKSLTEYEPCVENGLFFLELTDHTPFVAFFTGDQLEVMSGTPDGAKRALDAVLDVADKRSVYRGRVVSVEIIDPGEEADPDYAVRFGDLAKVEPEEIILPADVMAVVERNVFGHLKHAEILRRAGRSTRHGVLFHGPPGVGKTLVTKYLARSRPEYTVVLLAGRHQMLVRESCRLARLLSPSMVVIEDVDLIAADREHNSTPHLLHDLMNEMDGLGPKADVIFLLTTNRPEVLEPALAARPGRIDQAIYFPLPDRDCRSQLFTLFGKGMDLTDVDQGPLLNQTEGASPAFIQELFRKAAVFAAERGETTDPLKLTTVDFTNAIREMIDFGGDLTKNLLGFRTERVGFQIAKS